MLRKERFSKILSRLGVSGLSHETISAMADDYQEWCPWKKNVIPHTYEVLDYLKGKYQLHVITNGFEDSQYTKLKTTNLHNYFEQVITSEKAGSKKPDQRIFEYGLNAAGADCHECVMVGDNLQADIRGARNAKIDQIYLNPGKKRHRQKVTFEIQHLNELTEIL